MIGSDYTLLENEFDTLRRLYLNRRATPEQEYAYFDMIASGEYDHLIAGMLDAAGAVDVTPAADLGVSVMIRAIRQRASERLAHGRMIFSYCRQLRVDERKRSFKRAVFLLLAVIIGCGAFFRYSHGATSVSAAVLQESNYYTLPYSSKALWRGASSLPEVFPADSLTADINGAAARLTEMMEASLAMYDTWRAAAGPDGDVILEDMTLEQAAARISRVFGVRVILADEAMKQCKVHDRFKKRDGLLHIVGVITGQLKANMVVGTEAVVIGGGQGCN